LCCSISTTNRSVFPFFKIWLLYPAIYGQAIPSAFCLFKSASTVFAWKLINISMKLI